MTQSSTTELEREVEQRRAEMAETAERLRAKLTPGQLIDEMANTFRGGDWSTAATNLKTQVRDNPLALALIGAGIACMAAGVPGSLSRPGTGSGGGAMGAMAGRAGDAASSAYDGMEGAASGMRDGMTAAGATIGDNLSAGASRFSDMARNAGGRTREAAQSLEDEFMGMLHREPLVVGAVGLAIGAAIGALLPETRFEEEHLGEYEDRMLRAGTDAVKRAAGTVREVAAAAGQAALDEAGRQGIVDEGEANDLERAGGRIAGQLDRMGTSSGSGSSDTQSGSGLGGSSQGSR